MVSTDLSNGFGSIDVDTIFDTLYGVYKIDAGVAAFTAYATKYRSQELKPQPPKTAEVGIAQGLSDSGGIFSLGMAVAILAVVPERYGALMAAYLNDLLTVVIGNSVDMTLDAARQLVERL